MATDDQTMRDVIIELAAAVARLNVDGAQTRLLDKCCTAVGVTPEEVKAFNIGRAERIKLWRSIHDR